MDPDRHGAGRPSSSETAAATTASGCLLSSLAGLMGDNCTSAWLDNQGMPPSSSASMAASWSPPSADPPAGEASGDSSGGGRPMPQSPGPAPGGAGGGGAGAAGGAGVGLAGFLTLAGLLLLAAPRALRRLRLSCLPWRTAFFVLIPERPG